MSDQGCHLGLEPLLTPEDIAGLTGMNYHGVLRAIRSGELKAARVGKGYGVEVAWYREWLEARVVTPIRRRPVTPPSPPRRKPASAGSVADLDAIEREERPAA